LEFERGNSLNADDPLGTAWIRHRSIACYKQVPQKEEKFHRIRWKKTGNRIVLGWLNRIGIRITAPMKLGDDHSYIEHPVYIGVHKSREPTDFLRDNTHKGTVFIFGLSTNRFIYFSAEDGD